MLNLNNSQNFTSINFNNKINPSYNSALNNEHNLYLAQKKYDYNQNNINSSVNFFAKSNLNRNITNQSNFESIPECRINNYSNINNYSYDSFPQNCLMKNSYENRKVNNCYILINGFDKNQKPLLYNLFENNKIEQRNIKNLSNNQIILCFMNPTERIGFIEKFQNVKDTFIGVKCQFIGESDYNKIVDNNTNLINRNLSFNRSIDINGYNFNDETVECPRKKNKLHKILDVFFNL